MIQTYELSTLRKGQLTQFHFHIEFICRQHALFAGWSK